QHRHNDRYGSHAASLSKRGTSARPRDLAGLGPRGRTPNRRAAAARRACTSATVRSARPRRGARTAAATGMRIGWLLVLALLGCNQPAARPESAAQRLARLKEREHGVPCPVFAAGAEVRYSDFALRFEQPILDRAAHLLIVPFALTNTTPVAKS